MIVYRALGGTVIVGLVLALPGCLVDRLCFSDGECHGQMICNAAGRCAYQCSQDEECGVGFVCEDHRCRPVPPEEPLVCPDDMVAIVDTFCIDIYEASRPDATDTSEGSDDSMAVSVKGVIPWQVAADNDEAESACQGAGKRLCTPTEWELACKGKGEAVYGYGPIYEPQTCNGIDTYGLSSFHLEPTGSFPECQNGWGAFDMNGNLWEHTADGSGQTVRGGAYNCGDSKTLHQCTYIPRTWTPSALGFRCCQSPQPPEPPQDAGQPDGPALSDRGDDRTDSGPELGCLKEDLSEADLTEPLDLAVTDLPMTDLPGDTVTPDGPRDIPSPPDQGPDAPQSACPPEMVAVRGFCIDIWEASREDATDILPGTSNVPTSRPGALPWYSVTLQTAQSACASVGKRLCRPQEWFDVCQGPAKRTYAYGNSYDPLTCNGIDTYCRCDSSACESLQACPYPHCFDSPSPEGGGPCSANLHVMPTGSFPECTNEYGVYDINGNVWEVVESSDGLEHFRGGAYNCGDSETLHRCDYDATWGPSAKGFRCCKDQG